jgi:hypothetical protein
MVALERMVTYFPKEDPRLDWVSKHDERSRAYGVREKIRLGEVAIIPKRWASGPTLDQGREGACVGFGWTQELISSPRPYTHVSVERANDYAREYYRRCLQIDEYPGEADEGTSVLAGAQVALERGLIDEYRWCFSVDEIRGTLVSPAYAGGGPVVIGIPWYYEMYQTSSQGLVTVGGNLVGGHCILLDEYHPGKRVPGHDEPIEGFGWHNSWSDEYGVRGRGFIRYEDLRDLLRQWGEACVPMGRKLVRF